MITNILKINQASLHYANEILTHSGNIAIPTETVYGLAALYNDDVAIKNIYNLKNRPINKPLTVHVRDTYDISTLINIKYKYAEKLIKTYMPGPLTIVSDMIDKNVGTIATCNNNTLAVRMPKHILCQKILNYIKTPIVLPSANISGYISPTTAMHVYKYFKNKIPLILDGGNCMYGVESTIIDVSHEYPIILRNGYIREEEICKCLNINNIVNLDKENIKDNIKHNLIYFKPTNIENGIFEYYNLCKNNKKTIILCTKNTQNIILNQFKKDNFNIQTYKNNKKDNLYNLIFELENYYDFIIIFN